MVSRRSLLSAAAGAGALVVVPAAPAFADGKRKWTKKKSANGWVIDRDAIATFRVEGSAASVALRDGPAATVLLHVARRWHYEIAPLGTGEGTISGHTSNVTVRTNYQSNYLSGTAIALYARAYPLGGSEGLWPHQVQVVRDILVDCAGTVVWGGDLSPAKAGHFHIVAKPSALRSVAGRLDPRRAPEHRVQLPGMVADPLSPGRRALARKVARP